MSALSGTINFFKSEVPLWAGLVKFSHSIFALPFALSMFLISAKYSPVNFYQLLWILAALVSARTAAMGFNRILDRHLDSLNPRTLSREIPANKISCLNAWKLVILSSAIFIFSSWKLGNHCAVLSPLVLAFLFFYSYTKRLTKYAHLVLGAALALAPGGVWYALTNEFAFMPLVMMFAVMFWVAGFDIIYSCQDVDFDKSNSLFSFPAVLGISKSLLLAKVFHLVSFILLAYFGYLNSLGIYYYTSLLIFGCLIFSQHLIVSPKDLSKANSAFFTRNGSASFIFFIGVLLEFLFN